MPYKAKTAATILWEIEQQKEENCDKNIECLARRNQLHKYEQTILCLTQVKECNKIDGISSPITQKLV